MPHAKCHVVIINWTGGPIECQFNDMQGGRPYVSAKIGAQDVDDNGQPWTAAGKSHILQHGHRLPIKDRGYEDKDWYIWLAPAGHWKDKGLITLLKRGNINDGPNGWIQGRCPYSKGWIIEAVNTRTQQGEFFSYAGDEGEVVVEVYKNGPVTVVDGSDFTVSVRPPDYPFTGYPVCVTLAVTKFRDMLQDGSGVGSPVQEPPQPNAKGVRTDRLTEARLSVMIHDSAVAEFTPGVGNAHGALKIKAMVDLEYKIVSEEVDITPRPTYRPLGIVLQEDSAANSTWLAFDARRVSKDSITVRDNFSPEGRGRSYNYYILIQRQDGHIGIIDPEIENESIER